MIVKEIECNVMGEDAKDKGMEDKMRSK